jgi:alpha-tubulin suppressor-like RCC1 family protein/thiol-disulfide isomerase/thioredoxin
MGVRLRLFFSACAVVFAVLILVGVSLWLGSRTDPRAPVFPLGPNQVKPEIAIKYQHVVVLAPDGTLWSWGDNRFFSARPGSGGWATPGRVHMDSDWKAIASGVGCTIALKADGTMWQWGVGVAGISQVTPDTNWEAVASGNNHCMALKADGTLWCWGDNSFGQMGDGTTARRVNPVQAAGGNKWVAVTAVLSLTVGLQNDGTLWAWGSLYDPQEMSRTPTRLSSSTNWTAIYPAGRTFVARQRDGTYWVGGWPWPVPVGSGAETTIHIPGPAPIKELVKLGDVTGWSNLAFGDCVLGLKTDGRLWGFGLSPEGHADTGTGAWSDPTKPLPVGSRRDWVTVATEGGASVGMTADGCVWAWGRRLETPAEFSSLRRRVNRLIRSYNPKYNPAPKPISSSRPQLVLRFTQQETNRTNSTQDLPPPRKRPRRGPRGMVQSRVPGCWMQAMKMRPRLPYHRDGVGFWLALPIVAATAFSARAEAGGTNKELVALGEQVLRLLHDRDPDRFALQVAPSIADWRSFLSTSTNQAATAKKDDALGPDFEKELDHQRKSVAKSARLVLDQAARLGLEPSRILFRVTEVAGTATSRFHNPRIMSEGENLPSSFDLKIKLRVELVGEASRETTLSGEYELAIGGALKFPTGWRTYEGISWSRFPDGVGDERTRLEMRFNSKVARHTDSLHAEDDSALEKLGATLIQFLRQRDEKSFETNALWSFEDSWKEFQQVAEQIEAKDRPSRKELEEAWTTFHQEILGSARDILAQAETLGLNFSSADMKLKDAVAEHPYQREGFGILDGTDAGPARFILSVESDRKSKAGRSIAGQYIITASRIRRGAQAWIVEDKMHWQQFPEGLLGPNELRDLEFENYVAEHGALPPGTSSPEIELVRLSDETKTKLSDFRGKVLVLEWWATSCGPCQEPMAKLQTLREKHPGWSNKVEIVTVSIDDQLRMASEHLAKRGWTNTFNLWAGPGDWRSPSAKAFRLHGIPTCYVLDSKGNVVQAGHPIGLQLPEIVGRLLGE